MKTVLLTGASGFIGRNILESSLKDEYNILAPTSKVLNLADERSVDSFFANNKIDIVLHAAVKPSHRNAPDQNNIFYINTRMFFNLERHASEVEKILVLGSGAIYDNRYYTSKMKEEDWIKNIPSDEHGYCKYVCEKIIENSNNIYDLRIFGIFGKYEDYTIRFISNAICKTLFDLPITIKQNRYFDYIYVNDLIPILKWFIESKPRYKSYNVTPDLSLSLYDLANIVRKISGKESIPINVAQEGLGLEYSGDNSRIKKEITLLKYTAINTAIKDLYDWYNMHQNRLNKDLLLIDK